MPFISKRSMLRRVQLLQLRAQTLRTMVGKAGAADIVRVCEADFTSADGTSGGGGGKQIARATMALCDPSCSGSGGGGGHYNLHPGGDGGAGGDAQYWEHVQALAAAQVSIVLAAMRLPRVRVVVYSTCSVHRQENEDVVAALLAATGGAWHVVRCLPQWPTRGLSPTRRTASCACGPAATMTRTASLSHALKGRARATEATEPHHARTPGARMASRRIGPKRRRSKRQQRV